MAVRTGWKTNFLRFISLVEAGTGIVVLISPYVASRALLGSEVAGAGAIISRIAGIALIGLGVACWPSESPRQPTYGMLTYGILVMLYLIVVGIGGTAGFLLWPAVAAHAVLIIFLIRTVRGEP
jgi:hypothetical protein